MVEARRPHRAAVFFKSQSCIAHGLLDGGIEPFSLPAKLASRPLGGHMRRAFKVGLMAAACLAAGSVAFAQAPSGQTPAGNRNLTLSSKPVGKEIVSPGFVRPAIKVQYPGNVEATFDLTYAHVSGARPLTLDIYRVPNTGPTPAIIFVHGGSYVGGDPRNDINAVFGEDDAFMAYVASHGYVVIAVTYRLADEAKWPAQLEDVKAAIRWVRGNADRYGVDPQRIGVWGESSGGHISAMVGATCGVKEFDKQENRGIYGNSFPALQDQFANQSSCVQAAVGWHATTDFSKLDAQSESFAKLVHNTPVSSQSRVLGCALGTTCDAATVQRANVLYYVAQGGADNTPFLLQAGSADEATPWQQSQILYDALRAKGIPAQLEIIKGANHYFNGASREQAKQVLDTFFAFLDKYLGRSAKP
jgi:acetyl esterase/lipase